MIDAVPPRTPYACVVCTGTTLPGTYTFAFVCGLKYNIATKPGEDKSVTRVVIAERTFWCSVMPVASGCTYTRTEG
jgi:hypothetical protein